MRIESYRVLLWDFDGVVKDSLDVKTEAFVRLFEEHGPEFVARVRAHHLANGGMSRYAKFPIYAGWTGRELSGDDIEDYSMRFSSLALQGVIDSPWVPGVESYLRDNRHDQTFVVVSATPREELEVILQRLELRSCFRLVFGSPMPKRDAIAEAIRRLAVSPQDCLMIGDARADQEAANANSVEFLLRRHGSNADVFASYAGPSIEDFRGL